MNVITMMNEVSGVANPMIGKPALPDFGIAADERFEFVRIGALDELNGSLNRYVLSWSEQEMNVIGHDNESM